MTRQYSDSIALAAAEIVAASGVDLTATVPILPLAKQVQARTGCGIDAAKRHVAKAIRLARHELTDSPAWGGRRTPAGGRPRKMNVTISMTAADDAWGPGGYEPENGDELDRIHADYETAALAVARAWWPDADEIEIDVDYQDTNLGNSCYIEVAGVPMPDDDMAEFPVRVWDKFCTS